MILILLLALQDPPSEVVHGVRTYLKGGGDLPSGDVTTIEKAVRIAMRGPKPREAGTQTHEVASSLDGSKLAYHIAVPEEAKTEEELPLLVSLHGQGGDGLKWLQMRLDELKIRRYYILAPHAGRAGWGHSRLGYSNVLDPLRDALARYNIDPDRVWLDGFSMGANAVWQIGSLYADRFAALAPRGGCPHFMKIKGEGGAMEVRPFYVRNTKALPVTWTVGSQDKGLPLETVRAIRGIVGAWSHELDYREVEAGHEWFDDETPRIMGWLQKKRRVADPLEVRWSAWEMAFTRGYWIEVLEPSGAERIKLPVRDAEGQEIETRMGLDAEVRVSAIARRKSNSIELTCEGVKKLRLWLNDRLVDLSKPVIVRVNNKKAAEETPVINVKRMLDEVRRRGDASLLYPAEITVKVP